jgi:hypothetical protein
MLQSLYFKLAQNGGKILDAWRNIGHLSIGFPIFRSLRPPLGLEK